MPMNWRIALLAAAVGLYAGGRGAWVWQASEYGKRNCSINPTFKSFS